MVPKRCLKFAQVATFRRKDDYIALAGVLGIPCDGRVEDLKARIKDYLGDSLYADIARSPRFTALLQPVGKTRTRNANPSLNTHTGSAHSCYALSRTWTRYIHTTYTIIFCHWRMTHTVHRLLISCLHPD